MIKPGALLLVADNSGAIIAECIRIAKVNSRVGAFPSCLMTVAVKKNVFKKNVKKKSRIIQKGQLVKALLITSAKEIAQKGLFYVRSNLNNVVLLNQYLLPYGTRLFGPIFRQVRQKINYRKLVSLAKILV